MRQFMLTLLPALAFLCTKLQEITSASVELIDQQPELAWYMRPYLIDFLVEIHSQYRLRPETLYLAVNISDRYTSKRIVYKRHYQLVGCAALWIAAKFEDAKDRVPTVQDLCAMTCNAYDASAFIQVSFHDSMSYGRPILTYLSDTCYRWRDTYYQRSIGSLAILQQKRGCESLPFTIQPSSPPTPNSNM